MTKKEVLSKWDALVLEKKEIEARITAMQIPNYISPMVTKLFGEELKKRAKLTKRIHEIEVELRALKPLKQSRDEVDYIKEVLKETFGNDFYIEIMMEARNRLDGIPAKKILPPIKKESTGITQTRLDKVKDVLIISRKALSNYIGSKEFDMTKEEYANFLIDIRPLNQSIPDLKSIKLL